MTVGRRQRSGCAVNSADGGCVLRGSAEHGDGRAPVSPPARSH